jgi:spermidine synthase
MLTRRLFPLGLFAAFAAILTVGLLAAVDEKTVYKKQSKYSTIMVTDDDQGLRTLWFEENGARQSVVKVGDPDHLELAYARVVPVGLAFVAKPERMLIVGLGGGSIPMFLHKHYPKAAIDVVDIDPDVVDVAKRFFGFKEDATLRAYVDDGRRFIENCHKPYDVIFLDAFSSENIPYHLATREFLHAVRKALTPGGAVVGNIWSRGSNPLYDSMVLTYRDVFDDLYLFDVRRAGNEILVGLPRRQAVDRGALARRASEISKEKRFRFDLGAAVEYGFRRPPDDEFRGRVLLDKERPKEPD